MAMYFGASAVSTGAQQGVRHRNPNLVRTECGSMEDVYCRKKCIFIGLAKV